MNNHKYGETWYGTDNRPYICVNVIDTITGVARSANFLVATGALKSKINLYNKNYENKEYMLETPFHSLLVRKEENEWDWHANNEDGVIGMDVLSKTKRIKLGPDKLLIE